MRRKYSLELARAVEELLSKILRDHTFSRKHGCFHFGLYPESGLGYVGGQILIHDTDLTLYGLYPVNADPEEADKLQNLLLFLTHANYGRRSGNFELDLSSGRLRYRCFLDCSGLNGPTEEMLRNALRCITVMFERYSRGIQQILLDGADPAAALACCDATNRGYYCANNEATPAESAAAAGIRVPWEQLYDELDECDGAMLELLQEMRADDRIL